MVAIRQPDGFLGIKMPSNEPFVARVENHTGEPSLIHWHGLEVPWRQDGVPGISAPAIQPGGDAHYDFSFRQQGTYWMHSHYGLQLQSLMAAPFVITDPSNREREIVLLLADFSFTPPGEIYAQLRSRRVEARPQKGPDLNDVRYDAFLANGRTFADPEIIDAEPGESVRLRIINASSMSAYYLHLGALEGELIAVDGRAIKPMKSPVFPLTVAQRADVRLKMPQSPGSHAIVAVLEGERRQTGIILRVAKSNVPKIPETAARPAPPVTLALEQLLRPTQSLAARPIDRRYLVRLTGSMKGYRWSINNMPWNQDVPPLLVKEGQRVELEMRNETRMGHPMHLHGHTFQVVAINGRRFSGALRDTVLVPPKTTVTVALDANNPGRWAFHCHLLYHLQAGMFQTVLYEGLAA